MSELLIQTDRLLMRPPRACDLDGWAAFSADQSTMRFLGGSPPRSVAWRSLAATAGSWSLQGFGFFSVILRDTGQWIGRVGPLRPEGWPAPEIGWGLLPAFQGRGYAREAAEAAIRFAFERLGWPTVHHVIAPGNHASIAVARALGSRLIGPVRLPAPYEADRNDLWGQDVADWKARHAEQPVPDREGLEITVKAELDAETQAAIEAGLDAHNESRIGPDRTRNLWVVCRDGRGALVGGVRCLVMWQWLLVDWLWIAEPHRGAGLGATLLRRAERAGIADGCTGAFLNTFSFQAPDFYRRQGYGVFGQLAGMPVGHTRYWMSKPLGQHH